MRCSAMSKVAFLKRPWVWPMPAPRCCRRPWVEPTNARGSARSLGVQPLVFVNLLGAQPLVFVDEFYAAAPSLALVM